MKVSVQWDKKKKKTVSLRSQLHLLLITPYPWDGGERGGEYNRNSCHHWAAQLTEARNKLIFISGLYTLFPLSCVFMFLLVCNCVSVLTFFFPHVHIFQQWRSTAITNLMPQRMRQTSNSPYTHHRLSIWPSEQTQQQAGPMQCVCVEGGRSDMYSILELTWVGC